MIQLLDYLAAYPGNGITYRASNVILEGHADASYLNIKKDRSCAGTHIMLSEDVPIPLHNIPVLKIAQIIKNIVSFASKAEPAGVFNISK